MARDRGWAWAGERTSSSPFCSIASPRSGHVMQTERCCPWRHAANASPIMVPKAMTIHLQFDDERVGSDSQPPPTAVRGERLPPSNPYGPPFVEADLAAFHSLNRRLER